MTDHDDIPERPIRTDGAHPAEEVYLAFPDSPPVHAVSPEDGLPRQVVPTSVKLAQAPPLTLSNLICQADVTSFVVRDALGNALATWKPEHVQRMPNGDYFASSHDAEETPGVFGRPLDGPRDIKVEPIRPQCRHYRRQLVDFPDDPDFKANLRLCVARRTDSGEFLSVRDMQVFACELREPRDPVSEAIMDERDAELRALAQKATEQFNIDTALQDTERAPDLSGGGIFATTVED